MGIKLKSFSRAMPVKAILMLIAGVCCGVVVGYGASLITWQQLYELYASIQLEDLAIPAVALVAGLTAIVWLFFVTGRTGKDEDVHLILIDRLYTEITVIIGGLVGTLLVYILSVIADQIFYAGERVISYDDACASIGLLSVVFGAGSILFLEVLLSLTRRLKNRTFLKHSILYKLIFIIFDFFKSIFDDRNFRNYSFQKGMFYRQMVFLVAEGILLFIFVLSVLSGTGFLAFAALFLGVVLVYWYVKGNNRVLEDFGKLGEQIEKISGGELNYNPSISELSAVYPMSQKLGSIRDGLLKSLEEQMKGERMRIDLVSNVSHDLKTPLTSIISYVDLLSKEENLTPEVRDYVNILIQKSNRLKNIVTDLFELARTTSGNAEIHQEQLSVKKLLIQTMGDMEDRIESAGIPIKASISDEPMRIVADGNKMYRVLQNLLDNALKYSMVGTRIFLSLEPRGGNAVIAIKNTASYEMDFSAEEIVERFTRGDKARTSEGSGLGLAIAESFVAAMGGQMLVDVDGDQFKVQVLFPLLAQEEWTEEESYEEKEKSELETAGPK